MHETPPKRVLINNAGKLSEHSTKRFEWAHNWVS